MPEKLKQLLGDLIDDDAEQIARWMDETHDAVDEMIKEIADTHLSIGI